VKGGFLEAIGNSLGLGKEADVFEAITPSKDKVALKFHRIGRTSFRQTRRVRGYVREKVSWFHQSRRAAEKEYEGLKVLFERGVFVPKPITQNRHTIMMGIIEGTELAEYKKLPKPHYFLYDILWNIRKAYTEAHIIHADLSEFNVVIKPDGTVLIIDWPQYVTWDHPNAQQLLKRDVENILKYFRRKFRVKTSFEEAFSYVKGEKEKLD
jgi:RIO kinase 2